MPETGQKYILQISEDDSTYTPVGKMTSFGLTRSRETIETNNFDSPDDAEHIAGMKSWSMDGEALYVYDDTGQQLIETAFAQTATTYYFKLTSDAGTAGVYEFYGQGTITELEISGATNEVVTYTISIEGTGAVTREAIST